MKLCRDISYVKSFICCVFMDRLCTVWKSSCLYFCMSYVLHWLSKSQRAASDWSHVVRRNKRDGQGGWGGVDVTSPAGPWHHSSKDRKFGNCEGRVQRVTSGPCLGLLAFQLGKLKRDRPPHHHHKSHPVIRRPPHRSLCLHPPFLRSLLVCDYVYY